MNMELDYSIIELERMVNRWNEKASHCNGGNYIEDLFDEFISRYIVLAAYSNILRAKAKNKCDSHVCTKEVADMLHKREIVLCQQLRDKAEAICNYIKSNKFEVRCSAKLNKAIRSKEDYLEILLRVLYGIRCNIFHGKKQCIAQQGGLLRPAIECLTIINNEAMIELNRLYLNQIQL